MTTAPDGQTCATCKWHDTGNCRRFPPQWAPWPTDNQHPITYQPVACFPDVKQTDWCGEHRSAE